MIETIRELDEIVKALGKPVLTKADLVPTQKINGVMNRLRLGLERAAHEKEAGLGSFDTFLQDQDRMTAELKSMELFAGRMALRLSKMTHRSSLQDGAMIRLAKITKELLEINEGSITG